MIGGTMIRRRSFDGNRGAHAPNGNASPSTGAGGGGGDGDGEGEERASESTHLLRGYAPNGLPAQNRGGDRSAHNGMNGSSSSSSSNAVAAAARWTEPLSPLLDGSMRNPYSLSDSDDEILDV